jgi:hypothetical protein
MSFRMNGGLFFVFFHVFIKMHGGIDIVGLCSAAVPASSRVDVVALCSPEKASSPLLSRMKVARLCKKVVCRSASRGVWNPATPGHGDVTSDPFPEFPGPAVAPGGQTPKHNTDRTIRAWCGVDLVAKFGLARRWLTPSFSQNARMQGFGARGRSRF